MDQQGAASHSGTHRHTLVGRSAGSAVPHAQRVWGSGDHQGVLRWNSRLSRPAFPRPPPPLQKPHAPLEKMRYHTAQSMEERVSISAPLLPADFPDPPPPPAPPHPASTRADLDEAVVLNEDGVAGQIPVDDRGAAGVQETADVGEGRAGGAGSEGVGEVGRSGASARTSPGPHLSADRICVHQRFQAWRRTHDSVGWARRGGWACEARPPPSPCPEAALRTSARPIPVRRAPGTPPVPSPLPIPGRSWLCGSFWSF
jgi:hypothetical protein